VRNGGVIGKLDIDFLLVTIELFR